MWASFSDFNYDLSGVKVGIDNGVIYQPEGPTSIGWIYAVFSTRNNLRRIRHADSFGKPDNIVPFSLISLVDEFYSLSILFGVNF